MAINYPQTSMPYHYSRFNNNWLSLFYALWHNLPVDFIITNWALLLLVSQKCPCFASDKKLLASSQLKCESNNIGTHISNSVLEIWIHLISNITGVDFFAPLLWYCCIVHLFFFLKIFFRRRMIVKKIWTVGIFYCWVLLDKSNLNFYSPKQNLLTHV